MLVGIETFGLFGQVTRFFKGAREMDLPRDWRGEGHGPSKGKCGCSVGVIRSCMQQ